MYAIIANIYMPLLLYIYFFYVRDCSDLNPAPFLKNSDSNNDSFRWSSTCSVTAFCNCRQVYLTRNCILDTESKQCPVVFLTSKDQATWFSVLCTAEPAVTV